MRFFASKGLCGGSALENLRYYVQCQRNEIADQMFTIQQAALRIERYFECIEIGRNAERYLDDET